MTDSAKCRMVKLGDVCEVVSGATPKTSVSEYWNGDIAWTTPADLSRLSGKYLENTPRKLTQLGFDSCATSMLPAHSVLLSSRAPIGLVAINIIPVCTNQGFKSLIPDASVDAGYLYYWLKSETRRLQSLGTGATFKELSKKTVERIEVPLFPMEYQKRVVGILDRADAIRAKRRQLLADYDELPRSLFVEMFGGKTFPNVKSGVLMPDMRNGLSPSKRGAATAKVLTLSAITQGGFNVAAVKEGTFDIEPPQDKRVSSHDFMMCRGNGNKSLVGVGAYSKEDLPELVFPDTIIAGRVNTEKVLLPYLEMAWRSKSVREQIEKSARTTNGTYKVNQQSLSNISIPLPPLPLQREFARRVEAIAAVRAKVERALALDDELFASLQSRAFRGEL